MAVVLCFFVVGIVIGAGKPQKRGRAKKVTTDTKVYLQYARDLTYDIYGKHPDAQFLRGDVSFLHKGAHLTCDSALYYQQTNSFEAFGHVKMRQGDTLTLTSEYAYYDGNDEMCEVRRNVILTHRKMKLYCDSLNYDRMYSVGYFFEGGKLIDGDVTLTSDWGQYSTADRNAIFYYDVNLKNKTSLTKSDTLYYDTRTSMAHVVGPSTITTDEDIIHTTDGFYNSKTDKTQLFSRSTIHRKDGKVITGDSLHHDAAAGLSMGYGNVIFTDTINKTGFLGNVIEYNEKTGQGFATDDAIVIDYSQGDTLYAHGDTIRMFTYNMDTDSVYRIIISSPHVRMFRKDMQASCDSMLINSQDSVMYMYKDPILWSDGRQILGEEIRAYMADSTIRFAHVIGQAFSIEMMPDTVHYNQISSKEMKSWFTEGKLHMNQSEGNVRTVFYAEDSADSTLIGLNYLETDTMRMYFNPERKMERIWASKHNGTLYPISQIPPDKYKLPGFAWFDYIRPKSKDDILEWRGKKGGTELKHERRRDAPLQHLEKALAPESNANEETDKADKTEETEETDKEEETEKETPEGQTVKEDNKDGQDTTPTGLSSESDSSR